MPGAHLVPVAVAGGDDAVHLCPLGEFQNNQERGGDEAEEPDADGWEVRLRKPTKEPNADDSQQLLKTRSSPDHVTIHGGGFRNRMHNN